MNIDLKPCFTGDEILLAKRLLAARAKRLDVAPGLLLRAAIRDLVFDEASRPSELTVGAVESAEFRADAAQLARDQAAAEEAARIAAAEAETTITDTTNQEPTE